MRSFTRRVGVLFLFTALVGCGGSGPTKPSNLVPVTGKVTVAKKPQAGVVVNLVPTGKTKGQGGFASTDTEGNFRILHPTNVEGAEPGDYMVWFSLYVDPSGQPIPPNTSPTEANGRQGIPAPWSSPDSESPRQRVNVTASGAKDLSFDLPAPKGGKK